MSLPQASDYSPARRLSSCIGSCSPCMGAHVGQHFFPSEIGRRESPVAKSFATQLQSKLQLAPTEFAGGCLDVDVSSRRDIPETTMDEAGLVMIAELGHGNHSTVHLVRKIAKGMEEGGLRCVKRLKKTLHCGETTSVEKEYDIMRKVSGHPRFLEAFNLFQDVSFFYIEMPYCEGRDFTDLKARATAANICLTEGWWSKVFKSCVEALAHLHSQEIVHCDVKEANLMIRTVDYSEPAIVLADFGIAQTSSEKHTAIDDKTSSKTRVIFYGTPGYIPPEVWASKIWRPEGDMFSLGVVIAQMLMDRRHGIFIEGTKSLKEIKQATLTREPPFDLICQPRLRKLVIVLLDKNLANRPHGVQVLTDKWFNGITDSCNDGLLQQDDVLTNVLSEKSTLLEHHVAECGKEEGSNSISTATGLDSQSIASSCSDC